jgi:hypothetical protein
LEPSLTLDRVRADGTGQPEPLTRLDDPVGSGQDGAPDALPGGRGVVFHVARANREGGVAVLDLRNGEYHVLTDGRRPRYADSGHLVFTRADGSLYGARFDEERLRLTSPEVPIIGGLTPGSTDFDLSGDGRLIYYSGGTSQAVWVSRDGTETPVDPSWYGATGIDVSPGDGRRVVFSSGGDIWIRDLEDGRATQLTFDGSNQRPTWTPDGTSVTFISSRLANDDLWVRRVDGSEAPRLLLDDERRLVQAITSPDGRAWVFRLGVGDERDLFWADANDPVPRPFVATEAAERAPTFSPNGRWVAYVSDETGQDEIYVRGFPPVAGAATRVSTNGGTQPLWSNRGAELFYFSGRNEMVAVQVSADESFFVGAETVLFSTSRYPDNPNGRSYDLSPDDQRFMIVRPGAASGAGRTVVVENFHSELARLADR